MRVRILTELQTIRLFRAPLPVYDSNVSQPGTSQKGAPPLRKVTHTQLQAQTRLRYTLLELGHDARRESQILLTFLLLSGMDGGKERKPKNTITQTREGSSVAENDNRSILRPQEQQQGNQ